MKARPTRKRRQIVLRDSTEAIFLLRVSRLTAEQKQSLIANWPYMTPARRPRRRR